MKAQKFECEEVFVTQSIGLTKERFDFVVDAFHATVADSVLPPGKDATGMAQQSLAQLLHLAHARLHRPIAPLVKIRFHLRVAGLFPEQAQRLLQQIAGVQRFVVFERRLQLGQRQRRLAPATC